MSYDELLNRIGSRIEALRTQGKRRFSERQACIRAGLSPDRIRQIKKGHAPKTDTLHRLAKALEVHPWYLFEVAFDEASSSPAFNAEPPASFSLGDGRANIEGNVIELYAPETERFRHLRKLIKAALNFTSQISENPLSEAILDRHASLVTHAFIVLGGSDNTYRIDFDRAFATLDTIRAGKPDD